jgi:hypothetical protein
MSANSQTAFGPEMSLISQQQSGSRRNAVVNAAMEEEFGRWAEAMTLPPQSSPSSYRPAREGGTLSFLARLLGRRDWRRAPRSLSARTGSPDRVAGDNRVASRSP